MTLPPSNAQTHDAARLLHLLADWREAAEDIQKTCNPTDKQAEIDYMSSQDTFRELQNELSSLTPQQIRAAAQTVDSWMTTNSERLELLNKAELIIQLIERMPAEVEQLRRENAELREQCSKHELATQPEIVEYCGSFNPDRHGECMTVLYRGPRANGSRGVIYLCADGQTIGECPEQLFNQTTRPHIASAEAQP